MNKITPFSLLLFLLFWACDAPRENPFDPNASNSAVTTIQLRHLSPSSKGIAGAEIYIPEIHQLKISDQTGTIVFTHPKIDSLTAICKGDAFFSDTLLFKNLSKTNSFLIRLNTKPQISEIRFTSFYENIENQDNLTSLSVRTKIVDPDGLNDIAAVTIHQEDTGFTDTLRVEDPIEQSFAKNFSLAQISPSLTPGTLAELNFNISVTNANRRCVQSEPVRIIRVIEENPLILTPEGGSMQSDTVYFSWEKTTLDYSFTYTIVLQRLGGEIQTYGSIPSTQNELKVFGLVAGTYFFSLQIQDRPGNICQSSFNSFTYQP